MVLSTKGFNLAQFGICIGHWEPVELTLNERDGDQMLRDDDILPADEYYPSFYI
jgi:hypothetical protein